MKSARDVRRRIDGGSIIKSATWAARTARTRRSKNDFGFVGLKIDERTSWVCGTRNTRASETGWIRQSTSAIWSPSPCYLDLLDVIVGMCLKVNSIDTC